MFDMTETVAPKSDQMNADDLITGPRTFTIAEVRKANGEQPINVILAEFPPGRPFKPCKSMRRLMVAAWGKDASTYAGHRLTLYRDPKIRFAGDEVGGIRISHMSHIEKRMTVALTVTRGKRAPYVVEPLPDDAPASPAQDEITVARLAELRAEWKDANPDRRKAMHAEVAALSESVGEDPGVDQRTDNTGDFDDEAWKRGESDG